jgi:LuxR family transcriptional regulator, maltose regulon positive regulatory protein
VPVPLARLAAGGQVVRVGEADLLFDHGELECFAAARHVAPDLLASTGGWPALAELRASAGADLILDYLWEEVLGRLGRGRTSLLARFTVAGGGDDEVAAVLGGAGARVDDIVASVPLVERSTTGWTVPHALWEPALRRVLTNDEVAEAQRTVAALHRRRGRYSTAVDLLIEAEDWRGLLDLILDAERSARFPVAEFGLWLAALPPEWRSQPEALLAAGLELQSRQPRAAMAKFRAAAAAFKAAEHGDGEAAAISHEGLVRWWLNDTAGLQSLYRRVTELAENGSARARMIVTIGAAAVAHLHGDSGAVLSALSAVGDDIDHGWLPVIGWLRSVAHRRNGDLGLAHGEIDRALRLTPASPEPQLEVARLRTRWLEGDVDAVAAGLANMHARYAASGDTFLARESALEAASKAAWLGELERARRLLDLTEPMLPDVPSVVARVLEAIARAALAVGHGDEPAAVEALTAEVCSGVAAFGRPEGWYWRDRAAVALVHVLVPSTRTLWRKEPLGPAHRPGLVLAEALEGARNGDLAAVRALRWPDAGVVRAHLPLHWAMELAAAATAARNPPPEELLRTIGPRAGPALRAVAARRTYGAVAASARRLAGEIPAVPSYQLRIGALGQLRVWRNGEPVAPSELRRPKVRELLSYLVARRRERREAIGADLWPEAADPGPRLRITLHYLQRGLQPERSPGDRPYFVRANGPWLELAGADRLDVDTWRLDELLDKAAVAERAGTLAAAIDAYEVALRLWRGEPFADVPYALWADAERARLRGRYVAAALRLGELMLAASSVDETLRAAESAIAADPTSEPAYHLSARAHLASGDASSARRALEQCRQALTELGAPLDHSTAALMASLRR